MWFVGESYSYLHLIRLSCQESFFYEAAGKYGLESDTILSNGSYRLTKWGKEVFGIRLYKNKFYGGNFEAKNAAVFFSIDKDRTPAQVVADDDADIAFIPPSDLEFVKEVFYKRNANQAIFVRSKDDELLGKVEYLRSSATLSQEEFSTSIDRLRDWSSQVAGIYLPSPNEQEFLASIEVEMSKYSKWI